MQLSRRTTILIIIGASILLFLLGFFVYHQHQQLEDIKAQTALDKQMLEEEYNDLSVQYEGYKFSVHNDSLVARLSAEQAKVRSLMEELKTVKTTNAKRIAELRRELTTLRKIMRNYVVQIDSLNRANEQLREENTTVKAQITKVTAQRHQLQEEKTALAQKVKLAEKLSVSAVSIEGLDKRGRTTKRIKRMTQIAFSFTVDRNITAKPGMKSIYVRISKPNDELLTKPSGGTFEFEDKDIPYSMTKDIEYTGEPQQVAMYWDIDEYLVEGTYRVLFFADGYQIGSASFNL